MRLITESGEEYHAHFWHHTRGEHRRPRFMTELFFHSGPCDIDRQTGHCRATGHHAETRCHTRLDVFHKETGRAVALDRLLKQDDGNGHDVFDRRTRTQIWEAYRNAGAKLPLARGTRRQPKYDE